MAKTQTKPAPILTYDAPDFKDGDRCIKQDGRGIGTMRNVYGSTWRFFPVDGSDPVDLFAGNVRSAVTRLRETLAARE